MRPGRFLGIPAAGLILLGVAAVLWGIGVPTVAVAVFGVLGGLVVLAGLWILARPPVLLRLGSDDVQVRGLRTAWTDITEVGRTGTTQGQAIVLRTKQEQHSVLIPVHWLVPARVDKLETELRERLNTANGYKIWDGTAAEPADPAE
jgi:membrane-bound ClpP family serine protease